ncbi:MAG: phage integrase [Xanthobacteraceae bacterium]|nr:MAG: phage integrase [Xanthobacteraceae bacterium]
MKSRRRSTLPKYVSVEVDAKTGKSYVYFRRRGRAKVRMLDPPYSDEFNAQYHRLLRDEAPSKPAERADVVDGTFGWLVAQYYGSAEFKRLEARTQRVRRSIIESMLKEGVAAGGRGIAFADVPLEKMNGKAVRTLRDRKAFDEDGERTPEAANGRVKALRQVFAYAVADDDIALNSNPARDIPYLAPDGDGFHSWTTEEVRQYEARHPIGTKARLALALLLYTAQRRSDVVLLGRQHVRDGWLVFTQQKNKRRKPIHMQIPIVPALQAVLDRSPLGDVVWLVNDLGRPFTANGFGNKMRDWCDQAGLPHCSAHGLRKASATLLAEAGATEQQIMAMTGHTTSKEVNRYTKAARKKVLAEQAGELFKGHKM